MCRNNGGNFFQRFFCLFEPRVSGSKTDAIVAKLGFSKSFRVEANGFVRGIWLFWDDEVVVDILYFHIQFIHVRVGSSQSTKQFLFTFVYASLHAYIRRELWSILDNLSLSIEGLWILAEDFNYILASSERSGGASLSRVGCKRFHEFMFENALRDLGASGSVFT